MSETPNLQLPYLLAAQAQKHVTHNEALRVLDAVVQLSVKDRDLTAPPGTPLDGDRYIVGASATGAWAGKDGQIAAWQDNAWAFHVPQEGWICWIDDEDVALAWDGATWAPIATGASVNPAPLVGVNSTADTTNRLSVSSPASLFNHEGNGHQQKIVKNATADTASQLYQTGFSGRAEIGLTGDDDFHFKVSADGTSWKDSIIIDKSTGVVSMPFTSFGSGGGGTSPSLLINGDFQINQRGFAGGALAAGVYGFDRWKADTGGANLSISGLALTLTSGTIVQIVEPPMFGFDTLAGSDIAVSVEDLSGGGLVVTAGTAAPATITAGSGRRTVTITTATGDTGNIEVKLSPASGAVTFARVKFEVGGTATDWQARPFTVELNLCQRYFTSSFAPEVMPANNVAPDNYAGFSFATTVINAQRLPFPVPMRAVPTITIYGSTQGTAGSGVWQWFNPSGGWLNSTSTTAAASHLVSKTGLQPQLVVSGATSGNVYIVAGAYSADAEL